MRFNLHIYNSPFTHETRMLKITDWVGKSQVCDRVEVAAFWKAGLARHEQIDAVRSVRRFSSDRLALLGKLGRFAEWYMRLLRHYGRQRIALINAHSLAVLPLCVLLKWCTGARLIYDTHELETETSSTSTVRKRVGRALETACLRYVDAISVVGDNIGAWYRREYGLERVHVVKNYPPRRQGTPDRNALMRSAFSIPDDAIVFIYHGIITEIRGSRVIIDAFATAPKHCHVVFMGFGEDEQAAKDAAKAFSNIHFHEAVKPSDVHRYVSGADVGIYVLQNTCLNNYFIAPNKIFDYLNAGLAVIGSDFPELADEVKRVEGGWLVQPTASDLGALIATLTRDKVEEKRRGAIRWSVSAGWETQLEHLAALYTEAGFPPRAVAPHAAASGPGG